MKPWTQEEHAKPRRHFNQNVKKYCLSQKTPNKFVPCDTNLNVYLLLLLFLKYLSKCTTLNHNIIHITETKNVLFKTKTSGPQREAGNEASPSKKVLHQAESLSAFFSFQVLIVHTEQRTMVPRQHGCASTLAF